MPDFTTPLGWVQHTELSTAIRQSSWAVMALESVHLVGLALLGGAILIAGLAALRPGGLRGMSVPVLVNGLVPLRRAGLYLMGVSGSLITLAMPFKYYANAAFRWKMVLLGLLLLASWALRGMSAKDALGSGGRHAARVFALVVLLLWIGVGCCGRLIGFL